MHQCICSDYPSGHFFRSRTARYVHQSELEPLDHEEIEIPDSFMETGEGSENGKVFLYISQLKKRILIDTFDIDSTPAQNITTEGNDTVAIGDDISNEQGSGDELPEDLLDKTEMDSGSTLLKLISLFSTNIVYR